MDSWTYALSYLPQRDISFGQDVIYTYGPLGYLVSGSLLPENYQQILGFKVMVHSLFLGLAAVQFWRIRSIGGRLFWVLSFLGAYHSLVALDYLLALGYLLVLSWIRDLRGRKGLAIALLLGAWAGFSALVKFTAGAMTFGAFLMYWLGHLYPLYRSKARGPKLQEALVILLTATGSAMAVTFVGLHGNLAQGLLGLLPSGVIALVWGWGTQRYLKGNSRWSNFRPSLGWFGSLAVFAITLTGVVLMTERPSMLGFVLGSLQVSSGYSSAMSLMGPSAELGLAIAMVVILLTLFVRSVTGRSLGLFLALTFVLWIVLKHGFVRQDAHVFMFFFVTPFLLSLALEQRSRHPNRRFSGVVMLLMVATMGLYWQFPGVFGHPEIGWNLSLIHQPRLVLNRIAHLDSSQVFEDVQVATHHMLSPIRLSDEVNAYLEPKTVDVMPWEIALIPANDLNWQPRRTLQSYTAYTTHLDNWTAEGLREQPPETILYEFVDLDGRHPFVSEPATLFEVFSRYQLSPEFPEFISTELYPNLMLLEPRPESRPWLASPEVERRSLSWNETMTLPQVEGQMLRGAIAIKESFLGKIVKTLLRAAPVRMRVTYEDGSQATYRILPTTSENGIIISHLPRSPEEGLAFWQGLDSPNLTLPAAVNSIAFETDNPFIYRSQIEVILTSVAVEPL
ncbi:hypothetical protein E1H12_08585 [Geitlerinema sp. P-1104]|uniref:hypothetical protein n=1 Tax=Geitlerinema sp. P-1104 TaxID=2546230 RepID=UPI001476BB63|nr:hypothetical protein [Geitlerinema sp. P-1104]NMG58582.1 hypothetical protein [Geitlerinema sp. P-1104]